MCLAWLVIGAGSGGPLQESTPDATKMTWGDVDLHVVVDAERFIGRL